MYPDMDQYIYCLCKHDLTDILNLKHIQGDIQRMDHRNIPEYIDKHRPHYAPRTMR